jgi:hypothetical protein
MGRAVCRRLAMWLPAAKAAGGLCSRTLLRGGQAKRVLPLLATMQERVV